MAVVELIGCRPFVEADDAASAGVWSQFEKARIGHYAWEIRLTKRVVGPTIKGRLGFFEIPDDAFTIAD